MKSSISVFILTICLTLSANSQNGGTGKRKTEREKLDLIGLVRSVKIESEVLETSCENGCMGGWIPSFFSFDRAGNITESIEYDDKGQITQTSAAEFDSAGKKIKEVKTEASGKIKSTRFWDYDRDGNQIEFKHLNGDGSVYSWTKVLYDKQGRPVHQSNLDGEGTIMSTEEYSYDKNGLLEDSPPRYVAGQLSDHSATSYYVEKGASIEETKVIGPDGELKYRHIYSIDEKGDEKQFYFDGTGKPLHKHVWEYSKRDSHGNWTVAIFSYWETKDGELVLKGKEKITRKITYY